MGPSMSGYMIAQHGSPWSDTRDAGAQDKAVNKTDTEQKYELRTTSSSPTRYHRRIAVAVVVAVVVAAVVCHRAKGAAFAAKPPWRETVVLRRSEGCVRFVFVDNFSFHSVPFRWVSSFSSRPVLLTQFLLGNRACVCVFFVLFFFRLIMTEVRNEGVVPKMGSSLVKCVGISSASKQASKQASFFISL